MNKRPILVVFLAVFGIFAGQQMVTPVLAPLARELGLSEIHLGIVLTIAASGVVLVSSFWGRRSVTWGHRPVLLISLVGAGVALLAFAVVAQIGLAVALSVPLLFVLILLTRGVIFGLAWAATPVTAQSYVASVTTGAAERVKGMSMVGAAQGLGIAVGPAVGGLLVSGGLLVPLYVAPVILGVTALVVYIGLPRPATTGSTPVLAKVRAFDPRMWPFLLTGFGMFLAFGTVMMTIGFLLQDRLGLTAQETGQQTGLVMLAGAGAMLVAQGAVVPRLGWPPLRLMRVGAVIMTVGMVGIAVAPGGPLIAVGMAALGAGMGVGLPGYMAAPTLLATSDEQGAVAGLVASTNALTFVFGPLVGTALYEIAPVTPYVVGSFLLVAVVAFVLLHPGVRQTPNPATVRAV